MIDRDRWIFTLRIASVAAQMIEEKVKSNSKDTEIQNSFFYKVTGSIVNTAFPDHVLTC